MKPLFYSLLLLLCLQSLPALAKSVIKTPPQVIHGNNRDTIKGGHFEYEAFWEYLKTQKSDTVVVYGTLIEPLPADHSHRKKHEAQRKWGEAPPIGQKKLDNALFECNKVLFLVNLIPVSSARLNNAHYKYFNHNIEFIRFNKFVKFVVDESDGSLADGIIFFGFENCSFEHGLVADGTFTQPKDKRRDFSIYNCVFEAPFQLFGFTRLLITESTAYIRQPTPRYAYPEMRRYDIENLYNCSLKATRLSVPDEDNMADAVDVSNLRIINSTDTLSDQKLKLHVHGREVIINSCRFDCGLNIGLWLQDLEQFEMSDVLSRGRLIIKSKSLPTGTDFLDTYFEQGLYILPKIILPEYDLRSQWKSYNHIGLVQDEVFEPNFGDPIDLDSLDAQEDYIRYNYLMSIHKRFHGYFDERGDIQSKNACYVAMRKLESKYLASKYQYDNSLNTWFRWRMNQFLDMFSAYGTEPSRALVTAFFVIIGFALIYMLFPSETDNLYRRQLQIKNERMREKARGSWWVTSWALFIGWGITMRVVNAVALSANAFVTLGYGEIQAEGISRYLAVLQGLIGWFLLAIFSASLIGQIMQ